MFWLFVCLSLLQSVAPQTPARDAAMPPAAGTAVIRGRVTDADSGLPLPRVIVAIPSRTGGDKPISAQTDGDGRYQLSGVPAGSHTVIASLPPYRATHLPQAYGDTEVTNLFGARGAGGRVDVAEGQVRERIDIAMHRSLAINGRVVDEDGEPMANVRVRVESVGDRRSAATAVPRETDDRGTFRVFGLAPGGYRVCAETGRSALSGDWPAESPLPTCYPDDAQRPLVLASADLTEVQLRLRRGRRFSISGIVVDGSGQPVDRPSVNLVTERGLAVPNSGLLTGRDGRFTATGLLPGDYSLEASVGLNPFEAGGEKREKQVGVLPLRIDAGNIEGLVLTLGKGVRFAGRVVVEDGPLPKGTKLAVVAVMDRPYERQFYGEAPHGTVAEDLTFEIADVFGPVQFLCRGLPKGWVTKGVRSVSRDITDRPVEFSATTVWPLEIVISSRGAVATGLVVDDAGTPVTGAWVAVAPVEATASWRPEVSGALFTSEKGAFTTPGLRAGEYLIAALDPGSVVPDLLGGRDAAFHQRLAKVGSRIVLAEGERRSIDLRVTRLPEGR